MAILVTGGAGYIGSVTVERLRAKGQQVVVLDDFGRGHHATLERDVPFYEGRAGDRALLKRVTTEHKIEACVHFAALAYVGESISEPARYFENKIAPTFRGCKRRRSLFSFRISFNFAVKSLTDTQLDLAD